MTTQARIASVTLAGNSLTFTDVRKACERYADEFLRDLKETESYNSHTVYVSQAKETRTVTDNSEQETEDSDVETGLAALSEGDSADLEETNVQDILLAYMESRQLQAVQRVRRGHRPATENAQTKGNWGHEMVKR